MIDIAHNRIDVFVSLWKYHLKYKGQATDCQGIKGKCLTSS